MLDLILQGSVQGSVRAGQLSYEGKIDLCEVNLTRVQLIGTCEAKRPAPETISIPASNDIVLGGFVSPWLWSGLFPGQNHDFPSNQFQPMPQTH